MIDGRPLVPLLNATNTFPPRMCSACESIFNLKQVGEEIVCVPCLVDRLLKSEQVQKARIEHLENQVNQLVLKLSKVDHDISNFDDPFATF